MFAPCTAPTVDEVIEEQAARIAELENALRPFADIWACCTPMIRPHCFAKLEEWYENAHRLIYSLETSNT